MITMATTEIRNLRDGENIPNELRTPFPQVWEFDSDWTWVAERDGEMVATLFAGLCQGIVFVLMIRSIDKHKSVVMKLIREASADCLARGHKAYMIYFNLQEENQVKLMRIAKKAGAVILPHASVCVGGEFNKVVRR